MSSKNIVFKQSPKTEHGLANKPEVIQLNNAEQIARQRNQKILVALDVIGILILAGYICFINLSNRPLSMPDEVYEIQASIEMLQGEKWWLPTYNGEPWLHKPPLKMWMTWLPINNFPETNFSFRFIDATAGVITTLLLFYFSLSLFSSRLAAWTSAIAFLGCDILIRYHGFRSANQDSVLTLFSIIAIVAGWKVIKQASLPWAVIGGFAVGGAVLTKSAAGLIGLIVISAFCLLSGKLFEIIRNSWLPIVTTIACSVLAISAYFLPVCLYEAGACQEYFGENILYRIQSGHGNVNGPWFYLIRIFQERGTVPPELLTAGLLIALYYWLIKRDDRYSFLFIWSVIPVLCFSFSQTKLSWYIASALGGMSLLCGVVVMILGRYTFPALAAWWSKNQRPTAKVLISGTLLLVSFLLLGTNLSETVAATARDGERNRLAFDLLTEDIRKWEHTQGRKARIGFFETTKWSRDEKPYALLLTHNGFVANDINEAKQLLREEKLDFFFTRPKNVDELALVRTPTVFGELEPNSGRSRWISVLGFVKEGSFSGLEQTKTLLNFGSNDVKIISGFASPGTMEGLSIRWSTGNSSSFLARGNKLLEKFGAYAYLNFAPDTEDKINISITINGKNITTLKPTNNKIKTYQFKIDPEILHPGDNILKLELQTLDKNPIDPRKRILLLNWLSLRLDEVTL